MRKRIGMEKYGAIRRLCRLRKLLLRLPCTDRLFYNQYKHQLVYPADHPITVLYNKLEKRFMVKAVEDMVLSLAGQEREAIGSYFTHNPLQPKQERRRPMTITELNKQRPAHYKALIESGQIAKVLHLDVAGSTDLHSVKSAIRHALTVAKAEETNRYMEPHEQYYGSGLIDRYNHLVYYFPCIGDRDYARLKHELEIAAMRLRHITAAWTINSD